MQNDEMRHNMSLLMDLEPESTFLKTFGNGEFRCEYRFRIADLLPGFRALLVPLDEPLLPVDDPERACPRGGVGPAGRNGTSACGERPEL